MNYKKLPCFQFNNPYELESFLYKEGQEHRLEDILILMKSNPLFKGSGRKRKLEIICQWWNEIHDFEKLSPILFEAYKSVYILLFYLKKHIVEKEIKKLKEKLNEIAVSN